MLGKNLGPDKERESSYNTASSYRGRSRPCSKLLPKYLLFPGILFLL